MWAFPASVGEASQRWGRSVSSADGFAELNPDILRVFLVRSSFDSAQGECETDEKIVKIEQPDKSMEIPPGMEDVPGTFKERYGGKFSSVESGSAKTMFGGSDDV